jgi:hypothetical protein
MITVNTFSLSIEGLKLAYAVSNQKTIIKLDARATCNLLQDLNVIEGFDFDKNNEPVIFFTVNTQGINSTGFCFWCDFVKSYPFGQRHAEIIADHLESAKAYRKIINKINTLLQPVFTPELVY